MELRRGLEAQFARNEAKSLRDLESRVGEEVGVSPWIEVTQERIDTFAKAIDDFQWIHVDPARAKNSRRSAAPSRTASSPCRCSRTCRSAPSASPTARWA